MANKQMGGKKAARKAEGLQNKVLERKDEKEYQVTKQQNTYMKASMGKVVSENQNLLGFGEIKDDDDENPNYADRGAGGAGRGGRGGRRNQEGAQRGGRRQNAKAALKKTDEEFPTL